MAFSITLKELEGRFLMLTDEKVDALLARALLDKQYRFFTLSRPWSFMKKIDGAIITKATKTNGTVAVTSGLTTVNGTGTSFNLSDKDSFILINDTRYKVVSASGQQLTLDKGYAGSTASGLSYTLFTNEFALDADVDLVLTMTNPSFPMTEATHRSLDTRDPKRTSFGTPWVYVYLDIDTTTNSRRVELWPIPDTAMRINYTGMKVGKLDTPNQLVIGFYDVVLESALELGCMAVYAKSGDQRWLELAQMYKQRWPLSLELLERRDDAAWGLPRVQTTRFDDTFLSSDYEAKHDTWPRYNW